MIKNFHFISVYKKTYLLNSLSSNLIFPLQIILEYSLILLKRSILLFSKIINGNFQLDNLRLQYMDNKINAAITIFPLMTQIKLN